MSSGYSKINYNDNLGYRMLHVEGENATTSSLDYLHYSSEYMLVYFRHGKGRIKIEGRHYNIREGDIIMINPSELFYFKVDGDGYHERLTLAVNEALVKDFPYDCSSMFFPFYKRENGNGNRIPSELAESSEISGLLCEILECIKSPEPSIRALSFCKTVECLVKLGNSVKVDLTNDDSADARHPLINGVLEHINAHFRENISVEYVADTFNIDKSYLSHLFKEQVGMSLWTYVILKRIRLFNSLIRSSESVEQACYKAGFHNYSNFFRLYKKYMKMTPTEYKKQLKQRR